MDEQNQSGPPQRYIWPRYVLAGVILGIVLAIIWMAVLVHRVRGQREDMKWPTTLNTNQTATIPSASTNTTAGH